MVSEFCLSNSNQLVDNASRMMIFNDNHFVFLGILCLNAARMKPIETLRMNSEFKPTTQHTFSSSIPLLASPPFPMPPYVS